jgi:cytidine deaminase
MMADDQQLIDLARQAWERAYAPYSHFPVGAAVLAASGSVYLGCNVENAAYPAGICAERGALAAAVAAGERDIVSLAVIAGSEHPVSPCGMCRQVIAELAPSARILLANLDGVRQETTAQALLPGAFDSNFLRSEQEQK